MNLSFCWPPFLVINLLILFAVLVIRGVKITRVELKDVRLPVQLQRAMAAEAESLREAKAKLIAAEGEQKSAKALKEAAEIMCKF